MSRGGRRAGAGRPPKGKQARSVRVSVRMTPAQAARLQELQPGESLGAVLDRLVIAAVGE